MNRREILAKLEGATRLHDFEVVAAAIDAGAICTPEIAAAFQAKLRAAGIESYPRQILDYALRIMNEGGEPISEEIFKVFWLAESLSISIKLGLPESETCMNELASVIRSRSQKDGRYNDTMTHLHGKRPSWLE